MFDSDFWEEFFIIAGMVGFALLIIVAISTLLFPNSDYSRDRGLCESQGGVWSEVVHHKDDSFCTYYNIEGRGYND